MTEGMCGMEHATERRITKWKKNKVLKTEYIQASIRKNKARIRKERLIK